MKKELLKIQIDSSLISPTLIRTYAHNLNKRNWTKYSFPSRVVESYELEFILESEGFMNLEDKRYPLESGDLCLRRPGEVTKGESPYSCYMISFSMTNDKNIGIHPYYQNQILDELPSIIKTKNPKYYEIKFEKILEEYIKNEPSSHLLIRSMILEIIYAFYQEVKHSYIPSSAYHMTIKKAIKYIEDHYREKILLEKISDTVNLSPSYFQKVFKQTMNISPNDYLLNIRLNKAKELLLISNESITEIAYQSGFETNSYFSYMFHKHMKISPTVYRKSHQKP